MSKEKIIEMLNEVRKVELAAVMQYMNHHYVAQGMTSLEVRDAFKKAALEEMKHAETCAERIVYLGGTPTTELAKFKTGGDISQMLQDDLAVELAAIERFKKFIKSCDELGDPVTRRAFEGMLAEEEEHADTWL